MHLKGYSCALNIKKRLQQLGRRKGGVRKQKLRSVSFSMLQPL
jgi:hypothetical protein